MDRPPVASLVALALCTVASVLVFTADGARERPLPSPLATVLLGGGDWTIGAGPPEGALAVDPRAGDTLRRAYRRGDDVVWLSVDYHPYQSDGQRAAARALLVPGHGWTVNRDESLTIPIPALGRGSINASLMELRSSQWRLAVVYWYDLPGHTTGSDHNYRARLLYNRLLHHRADAALIRVATPLDGDHDLDRAVAAQVDFVTTHYGQLLTALRP